MAALSYTLFLCTVIGFIALIIVVPVSIHLAAKRRREYYQYLQDTHDIAENARQNLNPPNPSDRIY